MRENPSRGSRPMTARCTRAAILLLLYGAFPGRGEAQPFTRITDPANPIVMDAGSSGFNGASWIDFNNDGRLDLFVNRGFLYRNDGGGNFTRITTHGIGVGQIQSQGSGNSWADFDNDGRVDCYYSGGTSQLYHNTGTEIFSPVRTGAVADTFAARGWACAWADYDNDGYVDLIVTNPAGFVSTGPSPNHLFHNNGPPDYTFTSIDTGVVVTGLAPYTVATWADYDNDGDMDLFIGSGPATGVPAPDYLYRNMLTETGTAYFVRITTPPIATDLVDGQVWNWIDYDNDGDLDAFLTNYSGNGGGVGRPNNLYRNDGNGVFTRMTAAQVGSIVSDADFSLANVWGDFDNDGDLDVFVTNGTGSPVRYYKNNGDGTFARVDTGIVVTGTARHCGITCGDYDSDGDLDLFIDGPGTARGLYRNDLPPGNGWINLKLTGVQSNRSAIGAKVRAKAHINGVDVWQRRDVSAQNSFNGQNMLNVHFGFGNAAIMDSLVVTWPRGLNQTFTNVTLNHFYTLTEGGGIILTGIEDKDRQQPVTFELFQNFPNPFNPTTMIRFSLPSQGLSNVEGRGGQPATGLEGEGSLVSLKVYDLLGREVATLVNEILGAGSHSVTFSSDRLASGVYFYRLSWNGLVQTKEMLVLK